MAVQRQMLDRMIEVEMAVERQNDRSIDRWRECYKQ